MSIKTLTAPSELRFIADILEAFYSRLPKKESTCSISRVRNHESYGYKLDPPFEEKE